MTSTENIFWNTLRGPRRWLEPWYGSYAMLGAVSSGLIPVLLPLMMEAISHSLATVGYVVGAFNLGALTSPFWGNLADRRKIYRPIFFGGFILEMAALVAFPLAPGLLGWLPIALLMGTGSAAVATCATLFVVEFHPREQWTPRIGWLQTFNGTGQVAGLLLAGMFAAVSYRLGLWTGAGMLAVGLALGFMSAPRSGVKSGGKPLLTAGSNQRGLGLQFNELARFSRVELLGGGLLKHFHVLNVAALKNLPKLLPTRFGRFILSWFFLFLGVAGFFAYFPLFMRTSFGVAPATTSLAYAIAAGGGVMLYNLAGQWALRFGAERIYFLGRAARLVGFLLLLGLMALQPGAAATGAALTGFALVVLSWPVISVTGTELTSDLSPISQGAAQGLNNAANAVATVAGTYMAGLLVHFGGYICIPLLSIGGLLASLAAEGPWLRRAKEKGGS